MITERQKAEFLRRIRLDNRGFTGWSRTKSSLSATVDRLEEYMQSPSADRLQAIRDARNQIPNAKRYQYAYALNYLFDLMQDENPLESLHDLRLAKNDFRVTSDLDEYRKGFGDTFNHKLTQLQGRIGGRWLDGGAGEARAMIEFLNTSPQSDAECVAMSVQRPASAEITLAERTYGARFRYIDGKLFDAFTSKELERIQASCLT